MSMGCAKFPPGPTTTGKQLVITLKVRGGINPIDQTSPNSNRYYFIAIDNDGDQNTGPWAAVYPPYGGTGWVTSANAEKSIGLTSFIEYDASYPDGYIWGILPGSWFQNRTPPQPPIRTELLDGGSTLRFIIDFSQIATATIPIAAIRQLDINFITTNMLPVDYDPHQGREWDALGPSGQDYVTIDTTLDRIYSDNDAEGDVTDPDLDIIYWSVQVQTVSSQ